MAKVRRTKTVSYFELVRETSHKRMKAGDWQERLAKIENWSFAERSIIGDAGTLVGSVINAEGGKHVVIASVTDGAEHPFAMDLTDGTIDELQVAAGKGIVETCVVSFLGFGNVVAYIRASRGAPGVGAFVAWLNECKITKSPVEALPVISHDLVSKLGDAVGVDVIEVGTGTSDTLAGAEGGEGTSRLLRGVTEGIGPVRASLRLSIGARNGVDEQREAMLEEARRMSTDGTLSKAKARLIYLDGDHERRETVNFLKHRITAQTQVDLDEDAQTLRLHSGVRGIATATVLVENELKASVDDRSADPAALASMVEQQLAATEDD